MMIHRAVRKGGKGMSRFEGKVCLIAGGARGIGAKTAERFSGEGGRVVIGDLNRDLGEELAAKIGAGKAVFQDLDVRSPEACRAAVDRAASEFGGLDCLVNCAIKMDPAPLADLSLESWKLVVDIGLIRRRNRYHLLRLSTPLSLLDDHLDPCLIGHRALPEIAQDICVQQNIRPSLVSHNKAETF